MAAKVSHVSWSSLPNALLIKSLSFLEAGEAARDERVCRAWKRSIDSNDQMLWKAFCNLEKIPIGNSDGSTKRNYKAEIAGIVRATIRLAESTPIFSL
ncbi:MAG: F-box-like domain-containing protein, partial [Chlamydiales bacterium]